MIQKHFLQLCLAAISLMACSSVSGQDLGAVGGLPGYNDGYCDAFATPAGVTAYLGLNPGGKVMGLNGY